MVSVLIVATQDGKPPFVGMVSADREQSARDLQMVSQSKETMYKYYAAGTDSGTECLLRAYKRLEEQGGIE